MKTVISLRTMIKSLALLLAFIYLEGCVAVQSFPTAARAGDTVTLAIGSLEGANKNNLTVFFESDSNPGVQVDITSSLRSVFNLYPDKTSSANLKVSSTTGPSYLTSWSGHGMWLTVVALDLPRTLLTGTGKITVIPDLTVTPANNAKKVEDVPIAIDILPEVNLGDAQPALFEYFDNDFTPESVGLLTELEPMKQILIRSPRGGGIYPSPSQRVSAAVYVINIPMVNLLVPGIPAPTSALSIIKDDNYFDYGQSAGPDGSNITVAAQTQMFWKKEGDTITVSFISHTNKLDSNLIRFSIVPSSPTYFDFTGTGQSQIISSTFYDENGQLMTGVIPELVEVNF
jgi:hypothetical protein